MKMNNTADVLEFFAWASISVCFFIDVRAWQLTALGVAMVCFLLSAICEDVGS